MARRDHPIEKLPLERREAIESEKAAIAAAWKSAGEAMASGKAAHAAALKSAGEAMASEKAAIAAALKSAGETMASEKAALGPVRAAMEEQRIRTLPKWIRSMKAMFTSIADYRGDDWTVAMGWLIPRKFRRSFIGDILEDCAEMREADSTERRIKLCVVYQWLVAMATLTPMAAKSWITDLVKQVIRR